MVIMQNAPVTATGFKIESNAPGSSFEMHGSIVAHSFLFTLQMLRCS